MSGREEQIRCRKCNDSISLDNSSCPHCGTGIRSRVSLIVAIVIGAVIALSSLLNIGDLWFFGILGAAIAFGAGGLLYNREQRIQ